MKKVISVLLAVVMLFAASSFAVSALTAEDANAELKKAYDNLFLDGVDGDVNNDGTFNISDARSALLYSAGLIQDGFNFAKADVDNDGKVTAIDARTILRVAAKIESTDSLYTAKRIQFFNAVINSIRPNNTVRRSLATTDTKITYDNQALVDKFNKQMNSIPGVDEKIDFGKELISGSGVSRLRTAYIDANQNNFPLKTISNDEAAPSCLITSADVKNTTYAVDQSPVFYIPKVSNLKKPDSELLATPLDESLFDEYTVLSGLDAVTIYLNDEYMTDIPEDTTTTIHGKCFNVPQRNELVKGFDDINNMFTDDIEKLVGTIRTGLKSISYSGSYVTVYFDHATGLPCMATYSLHYAYVVPIVMNLEALLLGLNCKGTINVTIEEKVTTNFYFRDNYRSLGK